MVWGWVLGTQIPGLVTQTVSRSMWAELSYHRGAYVHAHRPVSSPPDSAHLLLLWFLFLLLPAVENSHHKEPEVRTSWNPHGGHSQRKGTLWAPQGNIFPVSNVIPWTGRGGQVQGSFP